MANIKLRILKGNIFIGLSYIAAGIVLLSLALIIGTIAVRGIPSLTPTYIFSSESKIAGFGTAIGSAVAGTILLSIASTLLALPFGIGVAIYLKRYAEEGFFTHALSFLLEIISGTPSIVIGVVGFYFLVIQMKYITGGFSLLAGMIALSFLIMPVLARAVENAIDSVPNDLEDASYALGATRWETLSKISVPYAMPGIITGVLLSFGRAAEESAVVVFTAGYSQFFPEWNIVSYDRMIFGIKISPLQDLVGTLPIAVYRCYEFPNLVPLSAGFATAFILILIVMLINGTTRLILKSRKIG